MMFGLWVVRYGRDHQKGGGVIENKANELGGKHPPTEEPLLNNCWCQKCRAGHALHWIPD